MSSNIQYVSDTYCATCDLYFTSNETRAKHIARSSNHPHCDTCDRRFLNKNTLRSHYLRSSIHHYCFVCDRSFETASGLRVHIERAAIHREDSDDEYEYDEEEMFEGWEDDLGQREFPDEREEDNEHDRSWEYYDDCDFDDEEDLEDMSEDEDDLSFASISDSSSQHSSESVQDSSVIRIDHFVCPLCKGSSPASICSTACGHLFCTPCIRKVFNETGVCPVKACLKVGKLSQLRKIYLSGA